MARALSAGLRVVGWTLLTAGAVVVLYLIYSLYFTNFETESAQADLRADWDSQVARAPAPPVASPSPTRSPTAAEPAPTAETPVVEPTDEPPAPPDGDAVALLWFERPGEAPPVTDQPYVVVAGVSAADLAKGPGHYPETDGPGEEGNFAVAGHRTTHGAPFFHLDDLREGDEIHVMDREGEEYVYRFVDQRIVAPTNVGVLDDRPLGEDAPTITLTTCHPRFSNRQRLVVFGELVA